MSPRSIKSIDPSRVQNLRIAFTLLWSPRGLAEQVARDWPGNATGEAALLYWRVRLLFLIVVTSLVVNLAISFAGYRTVPDSMFFLIGASIAVVGNAVLQAFRLWLLSKIGGWSRRHSGPVRRMEQPVRFWIWAVASSSILAFLVSVAAYLLWNLVSALSWHAG